jgi:hypothetical protein
MLSITFNNSNNHYAKLRGSGNVTKGWTSGKNSRPWIYYKTCQHFPLSLIDCNSKREKRFGGNCLLHSVNGMVVFVGHN